VITEIGGKLSGGAFLVAIGVYVIFPAILSILVFFVFTRVPFSSISRSERKEKFFSLLLWTVIAGYCGIFGTMSVLGYLSFNTAFYDLGIYDHAIWKIADQGNWKYLAWGHFRPIVGVYALFYKLFPSAITLLLLQTAAIGLSAVPLYYIAKSSLKSNYYALLIVIIYFLYSPLEYNNLFDFHADHLIILLMFWGFYFLQRDKPLAFFLVCLPGLFLKESLILSISAMGFYAIIRCRKYKSGGILFIGAAIFFYLVTKYIMPYLGYDLYTGIISHEGSFSYLGNNLFEAAKNLLLHPWIAIREIMNVWKMGYIAFLLLPLLFIPLLSPLSLITAIPALAISLLSRLPNHYWIQHQYTASLIAPLFVALIYGLKRLNVKEGYLRIWLKKNLRIRLGKNQLLKASLASILIVSIYYNITLSPSPISVLFWKNLIRDYYKASYVVSERDRVLGDAIERFIPQNNSVVSQNTVNNSYLAHREEYYCFPEQIESADYVVLDQKRAHYVIGKVDEEEYEKEFNKLPNSHQIVFSYDGIYIFKRIQ